MTKSEAIEWLKEQFSELQRRRPGCADKQCSVCRRFAVEDLHTAEAFRVLESLEEDV